MELSNQRPEIDLSRMPLGEKIAAGMFLFACVQAALLAPDLVVVPGERTKLFTAFVCGLSLIAAFIWGPAWAKRGSRREYVLSVLLGGLLIGSGVLSDAGRSPVYRSIAVVVSALGGFWCARILLYSAERRELFVRFCTLLMAVMVALGVAAYALTGDAHRFVDSDLHPYACRLLLLSFAPIALILNGSRREKIAAMALFAVTYCLFYVTSLRAAMLIPIAMAVISVLLGRMSWKWFAWAIIPLAVALGFFFKSLPAPKMKLDHEPTYYRVESYPFSWHIAKKHPWWGIGLRAPREIYLEDYEIKYPYVTKERFAQSLRQTVTSENTFLNFFPDAGIPFALLYLVCLIGVCVKVLRMVISPATSPAATGPPSSSDFSHSDLPPIALLLALAAGVLHFLVLDGLLHPQVSWYFHLLWGLIFVGNSQPKDVST